MPPSSSTQMTPKLTAKAENTESATDLGLQPRMKAPIINSGDLFSRSIEGRAMIAKLFRLAVVFASLGLLTAKANAYTYDINFYIDPTDNVTGTIMTSCDNCLLDQSNIVSWSFMLNGANGFSSSDSTAAMFDIGNNLTASPRGITYSTTTPPYQLFMPPNFVMEPT